MIFKSLNSSTSSFLKGQCEILGNHISSYTYQDFLLGKSNCQWIYTWASSAHNPYKVIFKLLDNLWKILHTNICNGMSWLFYLFDLAFFYRTIEVINHFPDLTKQYFGSEDVILILSRLPNFNKMSKFMYFSLSLISLCFLTLWQPQFFMFTGLS